MPGRRSFDGARALVTGASSGLGRALSESLARRGARVVLTGRSPERTRAVADALVADGVPAANLTVVAADLTVASDRRRVFEEISASFDGRLDLAFNVAGVGAYGRFESHDESTNRRVFEINVFSLMEMCRGELPMLRRGQRPYLVNLGSIVARRGLPGRSEYSASKFAVAGFTDAIRAEWSCDGIGVLLVNPGFTATAFEANLVIDTAIYKVDHRRTMPASRVADATLRALSRGKSEVTLTTPGRLLLGVNRLSPGFVDWALGRWTRRLYSPDRGGPVAAEGQAR